MEPNNLNLEQQVRKLLATELDSICLSNQLFGPGGLFGKLASTQAERRALIESNLFRDAQRRLSELRRADAHKFSQLVAQVQQARNGKTASIRLGSI
jgi:hypothetical protein